MPCQSPLHDRSHSHKLPETSTQKSRNPNLSASQKCNRTSACVLHLEWYRLRGLTACSWGVSMAYRLQRLNLYLRGWMNYFGISQYYRLIPELESWLRRRIRLCYWKQWHNPRTCIGNLLKLGCGGRHAIATGLSRKGYWHLSKTMATQVEMTNEWSKEQGLLSIGDMWKKAQGYT
jgi:RNA-directed DNA polymerase